jgi:hypothetical protein
MFEHLGFIPQAHQVALQSAIRNHNMGTGIASTLLGALYKLALDGLAGPVIHKDFYTSTLRDKNGIALSTATDPGTGIFVQLAQATGSPLLTFGQKWAVEGINQIQGNIATKFW